MYIHWGKAKVPNRQNGRNHEGTTDCNKTGTRAHRKQLKIVQEKQIDHTDNMDEHEKKTWQMWNHKTKPAFSQIHTQPMSKGSRLTKHKGNMQHAQTKPPTNKNTCSCFNTSLATEAAARPQRDYSLVVPTDANSFFSARSKVSKPSISLQTIDICRSEDEDKDEDEDEDEFEDEDEDEDETILSPLLCQL